MFSRSNNRRKRNKIIPFPRNKTTQFSLLVGLLAVLFAMSRQESEEDQYE